MKTNVGSYDVAIRFTAGCLILCLGTHFESWWGFVGVIPLATALAGFCPIYALLRIDTTFTDRSHP